MHLEMDSLLVFFIIGVGAGSRRGGLSRVSREQSDAANRLRYLRNGVTKSPMVKLNEQQNPEWRTQNAESSEEKCAGERAFADLARAARGRRRGVGNRPDPVAFHVGLVIVEQLRQVNADSRAESNSDRIWRETGLEPAPSSFGKLRTTLRPTKNQNPRVGVY